MNLTREYIENLKVGIELDALVNKYVFNDENTIQPYSSDIKLTKKIINKYEDDILINYLTPHNSFSYGWHCNIRGIHSKSNRTIEESICKASIIYNIPELWKRTEEYENERCEKEGKLTPEDINRITDKIYKLKDEKLYTKDEIKKLMRLK